MTVAWHRTWNNLGTDLQVNEIPSELLMSSFGFHDSYFCRKDFLHSAATGDDGKDHDYAIYMVRLQAHSRLHLSVY